MKAILFLCSVVIAIAFATSSPSRGEGESDPTDEEGSEEPEIMPLPGSETPMKDPFAPYDIGDPAGAWRFEDLTEEEKVVAARGLDEDQSAIQDSYAQAASGLAERARAEGAAAHLGVEDLAGMGGAP